MASDRGRSKTKEFVGRGAWLPDVAMDGGRFRAGGNRQPMSERSFDRQSSVTAAAANERLRDSRRIATADRESFDSDRFDGGGPSRRDRGGYLFGSERLAAMTRQIRRVNPTPETCV